MGEIFAFPFRIGAGGSVIKVAETSDQAYAQLIAAVVLTRSGERPMFPTFGITNPVFGKVRGAEVAAVVAAYGPRVRITNVSANFIGDNKQEVVVNYLPDDGSIPNA